MNEADSEKLAAGLAKLGWEEAAKPDEADLAVVNTCVVRQKAEDRAVGYMGHLQEAEGARREGLQIAVMGCMVGPANRRPARRFPYVDVWARPQSFEVIFAARLPESTWAASSGRTPSRSQRGRRHSFRSSTAAISSAHTASSRTAAAASDPRPSMTSRGRWRRSCAKGVREVTLLGQTVEAYGKDLPRDEASPTSPTCSRRSTRRRTWSASASSRRIRGT